MERVVGREGGNVIKQFCLSPSLAGPSGLPSQSGPPGSQMGA